ncbi:MAG: cysteine desulfurase [Paludibacteraceae bacterium]|nr:cysteine desulfurase [Paludibacteraceae bacterium]
MFDVEKIRADFPILSTEVYGKPLIYFDNGATTQKPRCVLDRIMHAYECENGNIHRGVHYLSEIATDRHEKARARVARFIGAEDSAEIVFTRGTTESINLVSRTLPDVICHPGDEILVTGMEHHSNIVPWQIACERLGLRLKVIPVLDNGELDYQAFDNLLTSKTKIVACTAVSNVLGTVNNIETVITAAHSVGAVVLIDCAQAIAHTHIDVKAINADFIAFSGHKVYAPNGIGVLWGRRELLEKMPPFMGGGEMIDRVTFEKTTYNKLPYKFEAGTPDYIGSLALAEAFDYIERIGFDDIIEYEHRLLDYAISQISTVEGVRQIGTAAHRSGVLSFVVDGVHPYDIGTMLDKLGIAVRTGHHCAEPLIDRFSVPGTVRASFAMYNTLTEIDTFIEGLKKVLTILR